MSHSTSEEEVLITRMLEKVVRRSESVDRESLCVQAGQRVRNPSLPLHPSSDGLFTFRRFGIYGLHYISLRMMAICLTAPASRLLLPLDISGDQKSK